MARSRTAAARYDVHPSVRMLQDWIDGLGTRTGRSLEQWLALARREAPADGAGCRQWFKDNGFGTNQANWLALRLRPGDRGIVEDDPEAYLAAAAGYVEAQYSGKKEALRPVFEALHKLGRSLGRDVRVCPCTTIVPLFRSHVFAQIKPTTNTRVDLGLALAKYTRKLPSRVIDTGGAEKKDRITHRIAITSVRQIDTEVERWMRVAYELDG